MGSLIDTINEQRSLVAKSRETYRTLKKYMNSLANELDNISDSWTNDAGEKYYIIKQLNIAGSEVASICSGYKTYTTNIERVLDVLKDFAEFLGVVGTEKYTFKTKNITTKKKTSCQKFSTSDLENAKLLFELMFSQSMERIIAKWGWRWGDEPQRL